MTSVQHKQKIKPYITYKSQRDWRETSQFCFKVIIGDYRTMDSDNIGTAALLSSHTSSGLQEHCEAASSDSRGSVFHPGDPVVHQLPRRFNGSLIQGFRTDQLSWWSNDSSAVLDAWWSFSHPAYWWSRCPTNHQFLKGLKVCQPSCFLHVMWSSSLQS